MSDPKIPVAILVRVSTNKQETARQVNELEAVAAEKGWTVLEILEEQGISRRAAASERHGLARAEQLAGEGKIRKLLVHEVSRIGRPAIVHPFVEGLHASRVSLYWHSQRVETLLPDGRRSQAAGMMLSILAEMAHAEIETLSERIKSGLAEARRKGRKLGRPEGSLPASEFLAKHKDIIRNLKSGQSIRNAAKITGKGISTVKRVKALI